MHQPRSLDHYRLLGRSGLRVSPLSLGTMTFGEAWGWGADAGEAKRIFDAYADRGGNFIDTAVNYTNGGSGTHPRRVDQGPTRMLRAGHQIHHGARCGQHQFRRQSSPEPDSLG